MKIEIKSPFDGSVLFAHERDGNTLKLTLEAAVSVGAYLAAANLAGANLAGANGVIDAGTPNGWLRDGYLSIRVGCRDKRLAEGREYWAGKEDRREVMAALDYVAQVALSRGWKIEP